MAENTQARSITLPKLAGSERVLRPNANEETLFLDQEGTLKTMSGATGEVQDLVTTDLTGYVQKAGEGVNFVVVDASAGTAFGNYLNFQAAYANAKLLNPNGAALSATNRATLFLPPGVYESDIEIIIDADFVDIYGLGQTAQKQAVVFTGVPFLITATDVRVSGVEATVASSFTYTPATATVENCTGPDGHIGDVLVYLLGVPYKLVVTDGETPTLGIEAAVSTPLSEGYELIPSNGSPSTPSGHYSYNQADIYDNIGGATFNEMYANAATAIWPDVVTSAVVVEGSLSATTYNGGVWAKHIAP